MFIKALMLFVGFAAMNSAADAKDRAFSCGIYSVVAFSRYLGHPLNEQKVKALSDKYPQPELSLANVQRMAGDLAIPLIGIEASLSELAETGQPFIAVLPDHFVFVESLDSSNVYYIDNGQAKLSSLQDFKHVYQSKALVAEGKNYQSTLSIRSTVVNLGIIPLGVLNKHFEVEMENKTSQEAIIKDVIPSCSCMTITSFPKKISAKQKGKILISLRPPTQGDILRSVTILSSGPAPLHEFFIVGRVEDDVRSIPSSIDFGDVTQGEKFLRSIKVDDKAHKLIFPLQVATTSPNLSAKITAMTATACEVTIEPDTSHLGVVDDMVMLSGQAKAGRVVRVPIHARIVPMTRTRPEQVVFGSLSPGGATRRLQIFRQDRQAFEVTGIEAPSYLRCQVETPNQRHTEWSVRVAIDPAKAPAQVSDKIVFTIKHANQEENLPVAVLALNEGNTAPIPPITPALPDASQAALLPRAEDDPEARIGAPQPTFRVGQAAPDFQVADANGNPWHLKALRGQKNVLLTFFPKCFTGGCATQLSSLRDHQSDFDALQTQIMAVSVDPAEGEHGQLAFAKQWGFAFPLIPDTKRQLSRQFGALQNDDERAARLSFFIDKQGIVRWIDTDVHVATHGADVLAKIKGLGLNK